MIDRIAHRGPDGHGVWMEGPVGLGHRRLAIIDLSPGGRQPTLTPTAASPSLTTASSTTSSNCAPSWNAGHHFRTRSDTESLLAAFAQWGLNALPRFNGMFAFALYDRKERTRPPPTASA